MKKFVYLSCACLALAASAASAATVQNGGFETFDKSQLNGSGWSIYDNLPGWTGGPNVEVQSDRTIGAVDAQEGDHYVELVTNKNSSISQDILFDAGVYQLSFYYSPRVKTPGTSANDMSYSVGNGTTTLVSDTIVAGIGPSYNWGEWTEITTIFEVTTAGTYTLSFGAIGDSYARGCGNCGALIDNVSLTAVPLPASALLLLAGVGGLASLRASRRRAQS